MLIKIDVREQDLIQACTFILNTMQCFNDIKLVKETLPLGDIIICGDNNDEKVIIERKTLRDLSASIKDGRYEEQSYRLNGISHPNHNIIYLIEGSMEKMNMFKGHNDKMMLYSAMVSINYFKGFSLMRSSSVDESALMLCNCAYKIGKGEKEHKKAYYKVHSVNLAPQIITTAPETNATNVDTVETTVVDAIEATSNATTAATVESEATSNAASNADEKDYCSVVKKIKKDNITPENIGEIMLCQIPSISSVTALAILAEFKTLPNLIENIKKDPTCLKNITSKTAAGQTRKISKACIENVVKYLTK
jgi:ERCC4-type nuclease